MMAPPLCGLVVLVVLVVWVVLVVLVVLVGLVCWWCVAGGAYPIVVWCVGVLVCWWFGDWW